MPLLLNVIELLGQPNLRTVFEQAGYRVLTEFSMRKAISLARKERPQVIVADFFFQPDFRDRVSNVESLLAAAQSLKGVKVALLYDPAHEHALDRLRQRFTVDAAWPLPAATAELERQLKDWREQSLPG